MSTLRLFQVLGGFAVLITLNSPAATMINGAGATFPYPIYSKWFSEFKKIDKDTQINYNSIGSGGGIRQFIDKTVDFGASDAPLTDEQLAKIPGGALHIPTVMGAVVLSYNLKLNQSLRMSPELIAKIYLGEIRFWDDAAIKIENPGVQLPHQAVIPVYRSDGSGTTAIFTDYLSKVSSQWKSQVGQGTAVKWKSGIGGKGNEGVTGVLKQTLGAIGYIEFIYAQSNKLPVASIKNKSGNFVLPSVTSIESAAVSSMKSIPPDFRVSITDSSGNDAYPISGFTYILVNKSMSKEKGSKIVDLLNWILGPAQSMVETLHYAPLPKELQAKVKEAIKTIQIQ